MVWHVFGFVFDKTSGMCSHFLTHILAYFFRCISTSVLMGVRSCGAQPASPWEEKPPGKEEEVSGLLPNTPNSIRGNDETNGKITHDQQMSRDSNHPHDALFLAEVSHIPDIATALPYLQGIPCSSTQPVRSLLLRDCTLCSWIVLDDAIFGYNPRCGWATTFLGKPNNSVCIYIYVYL